MQQPSFARLAGACFVLMTTACGPSSTVQPDGSPPPADAPSVPGPCTDAATRCEGIKFQRCVGGTWTDQLACAAPLTCDAEQGCTGCDPVHETLCLGTDVYTCVGGKVGGKVEDCTDDAPCRGGACATPCGEARQAKSYIGCEYWPVDLPNAIDTGPDDGFGCVLYGFAKPATMMACYNPSADVLSGEEAVAGLCDFGDLCSGSACDCTEAAAGYTCQTINLCVIDAQHSSFGVVVSNPGSANATVTLENVAGMKVTVVVPGGQVARLAPGAGLLPDQSIDYSGIETKAYRLTSDRPIVAYQFNPMDNEGAFSNDASLLLPAHTYDKRYYVLGYPTNRRRPKYDDFEAYAVVVASAPGTTTVHVTPTCDIRPGPSFAAIAAGTTATFSLNQWQTLTLFGKGSGPNGGDLSGTIITSDDQDFGVFSGHEAARVPSGASVCCDDHLEDQLFPASTWGKEYAVVHSKPATTPDVVRIMAQKDGTTLTINPAPTPACATLAAGQFCEVTAMGDLEIQASEPVLVAHFMSGGASGSGDPSLSFAVPTQQYRAEYILPIPAQYDSNFLAVAAPAGAMVTLDAVDVTASLAPFGSGKLVGGRIDVAAGAHRLACSPSCGVEVGGSGKAVSYLFAGGLDLKAIVVE